MAGQFSFSFAGDDIEDDGQLDVAPVVLPSTANASASAAAASPSAFPVQGKPLLPPARHDFDDMLSKLPSKIAYSTLNIDLEDGHTISIPRRELWDVRVQLMAEEEEPSETAPGLGDHDVKTGIYEGGFKSWESSVDLVKVLASEKTADVLCTGPYASIEVWRYPPSHPFMEEASKAEYLADFLSSLAVARLYHHWLFSDGHWTGWGLGTGPRWCSRSPTITRLFSTL